MDSQSEARRRVDDLATSGANRLDLSGLDLRSLPIEVVQFADLAILNLDRNQLAELPAEISQLANLTMLNLGHNQLTELPAEIGLLSNLAQIWLNDNQLAALPAEIGQLVNLTELWLYGNKFRDLPAEIGQLANLTDLVLNDNTLSELPAEIGQLANLTTLWLMSNRLNALPAEIGQLVNLRTLWLSANHLTALPAEISQLVNLSELRIDRNRLTALPFEIGRLRNLSTLWLDDNRLTALPKVIGALTKLSELRVNDNHLTALPAEIGRLPGLETLRADRNHLASPLAEIQQRQGDAGLLDYLRETASGVRETSGGPVNDKAARLTRLTVSNYRSLGENVSVDFEPLTVLVGINGSGKSNLLDAPRFVAHALTDGLETAIEHRHGFDSLLRDVGRPRGTIRLQLDLETSDWSATYHLELGSPAENLEDYSVHREELQVTDRSTGQADSIAKNAQGVVTTTYPGLDKPVRDRRNLLLLAVGGDERLAPVVEGLRRIETYAPFPEHLRRPQPPSQRDFMTKFGENWSSVVRRVMDMPAARDLCLALDRVTGDIVDLRTQDLGVGYLITEFGHARPDGKTKWFEAARESDGTLRVAGILTALLQKPPLTMIGIEEPEQTVHTGVLPVLVDFFDEAAEESSVVLTTHSPDLLERIPVKAIRVVDRIDGTTRVGRLDAGQVDLVRRRLESLGGLLRSQGLLAEET